MDPNTYKRLKEEFVSDLPGTNMLEIAALSALFPALVLLRKWGYSVFHTVVGMTQHRESGESQHRRSNKGFPSSVLGNLTLDFISVVIPTLACVTFLADKIHVITAGVFITLAVAFLVVRRHLSASNTLLSSDRHIKAFHLQSITSYRFVIMLVTCVSILAVDFKVYPRRYAKTETYGTGLMDVGVGSFVVVNALVSREARNLPPAKIGVLWKTSPLLLMGFARLIFTKGVDYQIHVGEYGVHWNFFFTLAAVALLTSLVHIPPYYSGILGMFILLAYQLILLGGLNNYLNSPERGSSLFSLNKEGICSLLGYWGLYLLSVQLGYYIFAPRTSFLKSALDKSYYPWLSAFGIWGLGAFFWVLTLFLDHFVERVSRRMCNLTYVTFVLAVNLEGLGIALLSDFIPRAKQLLLEEVFNENMLATFLLANVLTGLVNLTMDTLFAPAAAAYAALLLYLVLLVVGMSILKALKVKIKF